MTTFQRLKSWTKRIFSNSLATVGPAWTLSETPGILYKRGTVSAAGKQVTPESALSLSAIFQGINLLSQIIGMLPLNVHRRLPNGGNEFALNHPANAVLHNRPNPWMTAKRFKQCMEWNRLLGGAANAEINWNAGGNVAALWPLEYWRVKTKIEGGELVHIVDGTRKVKDEDMIHVPLLSWDGYCGQSFLDYAIESIGLGLSNQEFAARYFGNGARPSGILKHPGNPSEPQRKEFRRSWNEMHGGPENANRVGVMWGGWEYQGDGAFNAKDSQMIDSQRFNVEEVARWLNIPPYFLRDLTQAHYNTSEQQGIDLVVYTLGPILVDYEQEYDRKLLSPPQNYSKHNANALLRGDMAARSAFHRELFNIGVNSINDIMELEDRNPIGPLGDMRFIPANMMPLEQAAKLGTDRDDGEGDNEPPGPGEPAPTPTGGDVGGNGTNNRDAMRPVVFDIFQRMLRKECNAIRRASGKPHGFLDWLESFYPKHQAVMSLALQPVTTKEQATEAAASHCDWSKSMLFELADRATIKTMRAETDALLTQWERDRASRATEEFFDAI